MGVQFKKQIINLVTISSDLDIFALIDQMAE